MGDPHVDVVEGGSGVCGDQCAAGGSGGDGGSACTYVGSAVVEGGCSESGDASAVALTKYDDSVADIGVSAFVFVAGRRSVRQTFCDLNDERVRLVDPISRGNVQ